MMDFKKMSGRAIDLNADMGESPQALANGTERELMRFITSANIACGGHAGDANTMRATVELAKQAGVAVGAHPSYTDRANFGRVELKIPASQIEVSVHEQILALAEVSRELGVTLRHVKPHGALYHAANRDREIALAIGRAIRDVDAQLIAVGQAGSHCLEAWQSLGLRTAGEAFADRAYEPDGTLRSRKLAGALIDTPDAAAKQAVSLARNSWVTTTAGSELPITAQTICIHSDTPSSARIAQAVRLGLEAAGIQVQAM